MRISSEEALEALRQVVEAAARVTPPPTSLYLSKPVQKAIKQLALDRDCKPHDILVEGVELVLAKYGRPGIRAIND